MVIEHSGRWETVVYLQQLIQNTLNQGINTLERIGYLKYLPFKYKNI